MLTTLAIVLVLCLLALAIYLPKKKYDYWKNQNVIHLEPRFFFGNYGKYILLKEYVGQTVQKICQKFPNAPYIGAYYGTEPVLIVQDPEIIRLVTTKDFYYFSGRQVSDYTHNEVVTKNLFFTYGDRWKVLRQNLTPLFSSAKMRNMFYLIENCAYEFGKLLDEEKTFGERELEVRFLMARYTMDCIGSCAFGVDINYMGKKIGINPYLTMANVILDVSKYKGFKTVARSIWPFVFYGLGFKSFPSDIDRFLHTLLTNVFEERNYQSSSRNDFIDLILHLKNNQYITGDSLSNLKANTGKKVRLEVDNELLVAQCVAFFVGGYETSATTMSFTLFELAKNIEVQNHVLEEVDRYVKSHNGKLDYDCLLELPYLDACIDESLRIYPVLGLLTREVVEDYILPSGVCLEKGMRVHIPVYHLHHSAVHFPNPEIYRPERFLPHERKNIKPYTYMPFGEGPRLCIGMRFAKMQMLAGLVTFLKKYRVSLADDMPRQIEFEPKSLIVGLGLAKGGVRLKLIPRKVQE